MRIVHLCHRVPKKQARGGGDLGMFQDLCALVALGHEVTLVVCGEASTVEAAVMKQLAGLHIIRPSRPKLTRASGLRRRVFHPDTVSLRWPGACGYSDKLTRLFDSIQPDVVWAEELVSLAVAPKVVPIVVTIYDFIYRLKKVRARTRPSVLQSLRSSEFKGTSWPNRLRQLRKRHLRRPEALTVEALHRVELDLLRAADAVVCVGHSEAEMMNAEGIDTSHIPVVGPTISAQANEMAETTGVFLFGNPNTAMRSAVSNLRREVWPVVERRQPRVRWQQVGLAPTDPTRDGWDWLSSRFQIHGYVDDLNDVFCPGDVSLMPYRGDTGGRAKFPVAAAYGMVNAGYRETFAASTGFEHGVNCLMGDSPEHLVDLLASYADDVDQRIRMSLAARELYDRHFTLEGWIPTYAEVLEGIV